MKYIFLLCCLFIYLTGINAQRAPIPKSRHAFVVIAHRGDHTKVPENTIAAFKKAIKNKVDYVEVDLRTTKDSVLIIMHDATVNRMTTGKGNVNELSFAQLKQLKIIDRLTDSTKKYDIPTFEEVLKICHNKINIYLDFKNADVLQSYNLIKKYGMEKQVLIYINTMFQYEEWRRLFPSIPVMLSLPDSATEEELKNFIKKYPLELLDGNYRDYTSAMFKYASSIGISVWPDIQSADEANNWDSALQIGFKGLQTDHPKALITYLKKKRLR